MFTKQNPFPPASKVRRSHYHPSSNQPLSKNEKKTVCFIVRLNIQQDVTYYLCSINSLFFLQTLSPIRLNQRSRTQLPTLNRERQQLTKKPHDFSSIDGQPVPAESWPSTLFGSSPGINTASSDMEKPKQSARPGKSTVSQHPGGQGDSVLAKYV